MSVPYTRITSRIDLDDTPCVLCATVTPMPVIDHCHVHGMTRGVLCVTCHGRMARVDADMTLATPRELFHRDNCPECRATGFAGVSRQLQRHATRRDMPRATRTAQRHAVIRAMAEANGGTVTLAVIMDRFGVAKSTASVLRHRALATDTADAPQGAPREIQTVKSTHPASVNGAVISANATRSTVSAFEIHRPPQAA